MPQSRGGRILTAAALAALLLAATTCGIEDYTYLPTVPTISEIDSAREVVTVSFDSAPGSSTGYECVLFYRIYISDQSILPNGITTTDVMQTINPQLAADYKALDYYTISSNNAASGVSGAFTNRKFYEMAVDSGSIGGNFTLDFKSTNNYPKGNGSNLRRSSVVPYFKPENNPYFNNTTELKNTVATDNTENINLDVQPGSNMTGSERHTYVAVYAVTRATDDTTLGQYYSLPKFVNIFRLPEPR